MADDSIIPPEDTRQIPLSKGGFTVVDAADYGWLSKYRWRFDGFYAVRTEHIAMVDGKQKKRSVRMHRLIMGTPKGMDTDHINGDPLDNRRCNLRVCSRAQNMMNQRQERKGTTSKYKGVFWLKGHKKWQAQIAVGGKTIYIRLFEKEDDAAIAYNQCAIKYFGEFARLNVIAPQSAPLPSPASPHTPEQAA